MADVSKLATDVEEHAEDSIDILALDDRRSSRRPHVENLRCATRSRKMADEAVTPRVASLDTRRGRAPIR